MTSNPKFRQEPFKDAPTSEGQSTNQVSRYSGSSEQVLTRVARALAAHGGEAVAFDLALDLILNDVVEQARTETGATGAAIALYRDGVMVCRATTGASAPDLGVRVETEAGLSGACLRTGETQYCSDTENDPRVDAQACRNLGVRSMLSIPLRDDRTPFGILEVLSAHPNAFGDRDIQVLMTLAEKTVAAKREADRGAAAPNKLFSESAVSLSGAPEQSQTRPGEVEFQPLQTMESDTAQTNDLSTTILVVLVIAVALTLGVLIGWRGASKEISVSHSHHDTSTALAANAAQNSAPPPSSTGDSANLPTKNTSSATTPQGNAVDANTPVNPSQSLRAPSLPRKSAEPPGGLLVTQNGKVIYRSGSTAVEGNSGGDTTETDLPNGRLIHAVEPDYPAGARSQRIQGPVVLGVQVLQDGTVGNVEIVSGNPLLAEAAVHAVKLWKYQPYLVDGRPVQSQTRVTINFKLPSN